MFKIDSGFANFKEGNAVIKVCVPLLIILEIITVRAIHFSLSLSQRDSNRDKVLHRCVTVTDIQERTGVTEQSRTGQGKVQDRVAAVLQ